MLEFLLLFLSCFVGALVISIIVFTAFYWLGLLDVYGVAPKKRR